MPLELITDVRLKTILAELRGRFEGLYGDRLLRLILYGSQARGDARRWSDIDVLVVLRRPVQPGQEIRRTGGIVSELSLQYDTVIQCMFMEEERFREDDEPLLYNVRREGIEV